MRLARQTLIEEYGEETIVWASYILYGDPTFNYMAHLEMNKTWAEPERAYTQVAGAEVRAREEVIELADHQVRRKRRVWWGVAAGIILASIMWLWGYPYLSNKQIVKYQKEALAYYQEGNYEQALSVCRTLAEKRPDACLSSLIAGNIHLKRGKLQMAEVAYHKALQSTDGTTYQKAEALVGLGRIASLNNQPDASLRYYRQASEVAPESRMGYLSQALLLEDRGDYDKALDLFVKAQKLEPKDWVVSAHVKDTRERVALAQDKEKQERIDKMVKELLESMKSPPWALPSDGWTSLPLTMWVTEFEAQGYSLQEGEERLLASGIVDQLLEQGRVQIVERAILDRLLEELKLGTSKLVDRNTALAVGKIVAARLILSGQLVYSDRQTQISMRLIETETGRITAAVKESFGAMVPASSLVAQLSKELLAKLERLYPLRGVIAKVKNQEVELNIGQRVGVRTGQRFEVVNKDVTLEVISIQPDTSLARITEGKALPHEGSRVEAITIPAAAKTAI
jgi:tetratricopeptide (TPR) repeat protein